MRIWAPFLNLRAGFVNGHLLCSVHNDASRRDGSGDLLQEISIGVVLLESEAAGIGVAAGAKHKNVVYREGANKITDVVESPADVMEMKFCPYLFPYPYAGVSDDGINIRDLHFRTIGVPHVERFLERLVVRCRVGCVPQSGDSAVGSVWRFSQFRD